MPVTLLRMAMVCEQGVTLNIKRRELILKGAKDVDTNTQIKLKLNRSCLRKFGGS